MWQDNQIEKTGCPGKYDWVVTIFEADIGVGKVWETEQFTIGNLKKRSATARRIKLVKKSATMIDCRFKRINPE